MINVQMDKTCGHCEKKNLPCVMFIVEAETVCSSALFLCAQCLSDALSAVVAAQTSEYRNATKRLID